MKKNDFSYRKFKKAEKLLIAMSDDQYVTYDCKIHGVFSLRKNHDDGKCPRKCNSTVQKIENIKELKQKYELELGVNF